MARSSIAYITISTTIGEAGEPIAVPCNYLAQAKGRGPSLKSGSFCFFVCFSSVSQIDTIETLIGRKSAI